MNEYRAFRKKMLQNPEVKKAYDELEPEFSIIRQTIAAGLGKKLPSRFPEFLPG
ncbi:MAG: hypothetical protein Q4D62_07195 [Planctomycetia bacterium]|nr:hypothetical protein [Planctomycetia bacterium]